MHNIYKAIGKDWKVSYSDKSKIRISPLYLSRGIDLGLKKSKQVKHLDKSNLILVTKKLSIFHIWTK